MVIFYMISTFLGSILELCYIKYHIITNSVIKSLFCIESILTDVTIKKKKKKKKKNVQEIVCVEVLRPSQHNGVMSSAVSLPNHTFTGQA